MPHRSEDFRKQVNDLWKQAIDQLEEVKDVVLRAQDRFETDLHRLRLERDKLLKKLGEQTYKLANQGRFPVPDVVKQTVDRLNEVINTMVEKQKSKKTKKSATTKKAEKKAAKRKTTKKKKAAKKKTTGRKAKGR